jgi:hypothetical protein
MNFIKVPVKQYTTNDNNKITNITTDNRYILYKDEQGRRNAEELKNIKVEKNKINEQNNRRIGDEYKNQPLSKEYHRKLGELYGYPKKDIDEFVARIDNDSISKNNSTLFQNKQLKQYPVIHITPHTCKICNEDFGTNVELYNHNLKKHKVN